MSYQEIRNYIQHLLNRSGNFQQEVQIDSGIICSDQLQAIEHSELAGLQAADALASSFHFSVKRNRYGETEPIYSHMLSKTLYRHKRILHGYGIKLWPGSLEEIKTKAPEVVNLEGL